MELKIKRGKVRLDQLCAEIETTTNIKLMKYNNDDEVHGYLTGSDDEITIHLFDQEELVKINQDEGARPDLQVFSTSIDTHEISQLVLNHNPLYNCRFCGIDQGNTEACYRHEHNCFRDKYVNAKTIEEKLSLRDLREGLIQKNRQVQK